MDEPAQFIFYPLPFPSFNASASISDGLLYLYGWKEGTTTFIAGGIYASSFDVVQTIVIEARKRLLGTAGEELKVLGVAVIKGREQNGVIESKGKGKGKQVEIELELEINAGGVPSLVSNHKSASIIERRTIILFKIPSKSRLQFLSLVPLQLDLNSFISAADFHHKDSVQKPVLKHKSEDTVLGDKLRQSAKLDFSSPTNAIRAEMANLKRVIDWVSFCLKLFTRVQILIRKILGQSFTPSSTNALTTASFFLGSISIISSTSTFIRFSQSTGSFAWRISTCSFSSIQLGNSNARR